MLIRISMLFFTLFSLTLISHNLYSFEIGGLLPLNEGMERDKSICGTRDERVLSEVAPVGRLQRIGEAGGCTVTMIGRTCAVTAGHCRSVFEEAHFNTGPAIDRRPQRPAAEDIYLIDQDSIVARGAGIGADYAVLRILPNDITGVYPGDAQGYYTVSSESPRVGDVVRITGYGVANDDQRHLSQQTHTGRVSRINERGNALYHRADTTGGNSGSSILSEATGEIIGIHTHGGCSTWGGANASTLIATEQTFQRAINACLRWEMENLE